MSDPKTVVDVGAEDFQAEVLERSLQVPVLIDFWAEWCGPCKTLGPLLEKLAADLGGRFVLAKVDIDREPQLAEAFRIQSIPTVMLVKDGRPVDAFMGALPEAEVRSFLEPHLGEAPGGALETARRLAEEGKREQAIPTLRDHLRQSPDDGQARILLATLLLEEDRAAEARKVLAKLTDEERESPEAKALHARLDLMESAGDLPQLKARVDAAPDDLAARIDYGKALVAAQRSEEGLEEIWEAAVRDLGFEDGAPRKALVEVFQVLGQDHPLTLDYQQRLSVLLCS